MITRLQLALLLISFTFATNDYKTNAKWKSFSTNLKLKFANEKVEIKAYKNFEKADQFIEEHNANEKKTFELNHNAFSIWDDEEMALHKGLKRLNNSLKQKRSISKTRAYTSNGHKFYKYMYSTGYPLKPEVDWVKMGWNTPVRDQGRCGSCWAFAAVASIEATIWLRNKTSVVLSPQQLVDCSGKYGNEGCDGGIVGWAYDYIWDKGSVMEKSYLYSAIDAKCSLTDKKAPFFKLSGYSLVNPGDDNALMEVLDKYGPVPVAIDASPRSFSYYKSGIFASTTGACSKNTDHAVLLTGYGITSKGEKYWTIKNQWGKTWGLNGYMNISRAIINNCGISSEVYLPAIV